MEGVDSDSQAIVVFFSPNPDNCEIQCMACYIGVYFVVQGLCKNLMITYYCSYRWRSLH